MSLTSYRAAPPRAKNVSEPKPGSSIEVCLALPNLTILFGFAKRAGCNPAPRIFRYKTEKKSPIRFEVDRGILTGSVHVTGRPGSDLLSHTLRCSTIGANRFHGRVRDGIGWYTDAITTRPSRHMKLKERHPI